MDLSGHHSNPSLPLKALLSGPSSVPESPTSDVERGRIAPARATLQAARANHPRQGRIIDAIAQVLSDESDPMQARDVHAAVQTLLGEPVRWASVKATLAGNLEGPAPRFVRVARGRYGIPLPSERASRDLTRTEPRAFARLLAADTRASWRLGRLSRIVRSTSVSGNRGRARVHAIAGVRDGRWHTSIHPKAIAALARSGGRSADERKRPANCAIRVRGSERQEERRGSIAGLGRSGRVGSPVGGALRLSALPG